MQSRIEKARELRELDFQKRQAINEFRPIKRDYVHCYRTRVIEGRQNLSKLNKNLRCLKEITNIIFIKVHHTRKRSRESELPEQMS